jgi:NAD(P)H-dependent flavin oxidoreductase YrpB (nitropropane dioxygenase family)
MTCAYRIIKADFDSTIRSTIWTGRPLRAAATSYIRDWESTRRSELEGLLTKGIVPIEHEYNQFRTTGGLPEEIREQSVMRYVTSVSPDQLYTLLIVLFDHRPMGIASGLINNGQQSAAEIIEDIVGGAVQCISGASAFVTCNYR